MAPGEHLIRLATAYDGRSFGVLALTDERVALWAAGRQPRIEVLAWPRECVHPASDGGGCLRVDADDELWEFDRILPVEAVEQLVDQLVIEGPNRRRRDGASR